MRRINTRRWRITRRGATKRGEGVGKKEEERNDDVTFAPPPVALVVVVVVVVVVVFVEEVEGGEVVVEAVEAEAMVRMGITRRERFARSRDAGT